MIISKIEKLDHQTWITISKFRINVPKYMRLAANAKNYVYTIRYVCSTFSQVHNLLIVVRCAAQNLFGMLLNTEGCRTHQLQVTRYITGIRPATRCYNFDTITLQCRKSKVFQGEYTNIILDQMNMIPTTSTAENDSLINFHTLPIGFKNFEIGYITRQFSQLRKSLTKDY